jgi:hypothetical protein
MTKYVTRGTVQFMSLPTGRGEIRIAPSDDYAIKHKDKRYLVFICDSPQPTPDGTKLYETDISFKFADNLREILIRSAFDRTCLELTFNGSDEIIGIIIPAKP